MNFFPGFSLRCTSISQHQKYLLLESGMERKFCWKNPGISFTKIYRSSHFISHFVSQERLDHVLTRYFSQCLNCFSRTFKIVIGEWYEGKKMLKKILFVPLGETFHLSYHSYRNRHFRLSKSRVQRHFSMCGSCFSYLKHDFRRTAWTRNSEKNSKCSPC